MGARDTPAHDSAYESHTVSTRPDDVADENRTSISRDDAFRVLQDERRRAVLRLLLADGDEAPLPLSTLAAFVAAVKHNSDSSETVGEIQERVRISLHHTHLPVLTEHDIVEYDPESRTVEPKPLLAALVPFLADGLDADEELVVDTLQVERHGYHNASVR